MVHANLWNFQSRVVKLEAHIADMGGLKAVMAVGVESFSRQHDSPLRYLVIADTAYFESQSSNVDEMSTSNSYFPQGFPLELHNLPLEAKQDNIMALLALEFQIHL